MRRYDVECALCGRVLPADRADEQLCYGCGAIICEDHAGDPVGPHESEDHRSPDDADDVEEPYPDGV